MKINGAKISDYLARLTTFDWVKVGLYGSAICGALSVVALNTILKPWGVPDIEILALSAKIGSLSMVFTLIGVIANTIKNTSPPKGTVPVLSTTATPTEASLTTSVKESTPAKV